MSSARYSISAASRSRAEVCSASSARSSGTGSSPDAELAQQRAVDDEVGVAADRRGEVAVRGAREARVAEVPRVVARLLERAQHERRERLAARGPTARRTRSTRCEISPASCAAACGVSDVGHRRRRHAEVGELREQQRDRLRVGPLVHAVERLRGCGRRGTRRRARSRGSSAPRRACARAARPRASASATRPSVEAERDLGRLHLERAAREPAPRAARSRARPASSSCSRTRGGASRRSACAVGEPRVRADHRAVEERLAVRRHLDRDAEPVLVRPQRAGVVGELVRQHRRDEARARRSRTRARAAPRSSGDAGRDEVRDVGDVHPGADPVAARAGTRARRRSPSRSPGRS